jgi:hypothetical protein
LPNFRGRVDRGYLGFTLSAVVVAASIFRSAADNRVRLVDLGLGARSGFFLFCGLFAMNHRAVTKVTGCAVWHSGPAAAWQRPAIDRYAHMDSVVETRRGKLRGRLSNGVTTFKGVPYASSAVEGNTRGYVPLFHGVLRKINDNRTITF